MNRFLSERIDTYIRDKEWIVINKEMRAKAKSKWFCNYCMSGDKSVFCSQTRYASNDYSISLNATIVTKSERTRESGKKNSEISLENCEHKSS